ncbi:tRNA (adenosine(37)-N6)-dimethylallyltransferase MiaA [Avrilella dinanensis]|uniref:tRNA dimethylallyltransferase n=1 Tax=Avrilella dinanensis TaxID=2008672 RepID=A0A2M9R6W0_9FLAO|nr:tRNA (adenosine(37)-N6)-dimethylallyltransferase MiaA [Avrilella dinanensis]PJR04590.1 tRNA (adenosine(37)-N6)-dimethylallyltransferase MiaA [Avrilella dinanensis]
MNKLIIVVGPTAIGKTAKAIELAKHFGCEIISADSRQFYQEMTIGTAVPSAEELSAVKHHFVQYISINDSYSVGQFERDALSCLDSLFEKNQMQIMVGGSGLYIDAVTQGLDNFPKVDENIKNQVQRNYEQSGLVYLQNELKQRDFSFYTKIAQENPQTLQNPQRMIRYVSVCMAENKPYSTYLKKEKTQRSFKPIYIGLTADREVIYDRINQRVDIMINNGLLKEVENLYPYKDNNALQTVGYRELFDFFEDKLSFEEAIEEIKKNTRRFAKRQLTWFNRNDAIRWFDCNTPVSSILDYIKESL